MRPEELAPGRTVEELAQELDLTDNGVRAHLATLERDGSFVIRGYSCPLAAVTPGHPEVCRLAETLIAELAGVPVGERCDRGKRPRCCFEVATPDSPAQEHQARARSGVRNLRAPA